MRQKDEQLKGGGPELSAQPAFDLLNSQGKIREIPTEDQRIEALVDDYLTRPIEQRRNTLIMATTHEGGHLNSSHQRQTDTAVNCGSSRIGCCKERPG